MNSESPNGEELSSKLSDLVSRRTLLLRAVGAGLSTPLVAGLLAACGTDPLEEVDGQSGDPVAEAGEDDVAEDEDDEDGLDEPEDDDSEGTDIAPDGGTVIVGLWQEPESLTWVVGSGSFSERAVLLTLHEPLVRIGADNEVEPGLLKEVPTIENGGISEDGMTVTVRLKEGLSWSDGEPLTIEDYVFTHETIMDPETAAVQTLGWDRIESIETPDDHTAVVSLTEPYAPFVNLTMVGYFGSLLPKHVFDEGIDIRSDFGRNPVGSGPFRFVEWASGDHIRAERNPYYHRGEANLEELVFRLTPDRNVVIAQTRTGDMDIAFDMTEAQIPELEDLPGVTLHTTPGTTVERYFFNFRNPDNLDEPHPALSDVRVREALVLAIDRQEIVDTLLHGRTEVAVNELGTTPFFNEDLEVRPYDPDRAQELLDEAGWEVGSDGIREKDGHRLTLKHVTSAGNALREQMQVIVQQDFLDVGVEMEIDNYRPAELWAGCASGGISAQGQFDLAGWADTIPGVDPDLTIFWHSSQIVDCETNPAGYNTRGYSNPEVDELLDRQQMTSDPDERMEIIQQLQQVLYDDIVAIWLYYRVDIVAVNDRVQGIQPTPFGGAFWNTGDWSVSS
jgi:peptide/nickel transport system substrate-binding protein